MNKSKLITIVNILLFFSMVEPAVTAMSGGLLRSPAFEILHGTAGLLFIAFGIIHIIQHWSWVKANFASARD